MCQPGGALIVSEIGCGTCACAKGLDWADVEAQHSAAHTNANKALGTCWTHPKGLMSGVIFIFSMNCGLIGGRGALNPPY